MIRMQWTPEVALKDFGRRYGQQLAGEITVNLELFRAEARARGLTEADLVRWATEMGPADRLMAVAIPEMAAAARVPEPFLLAYNLLGDRIAPEECTVAAAVGRASSTGASLVLKNSDKVGSTTDVGPGFHRHKEITVVLALAVPGEPALVGVSAAGSTGVKMGLNSAGVITASNLGRTQGLAERNLSIDKIRLSGRSQIMREALRQTSARAALDGALARVLDAPMGTPGNLHFYDAQGGFVLEAAYAELAVQRCADGDRVARGNRFEVLRHLNDPTDESSHYRYERAAELLNGTQDPLEVAHMIEISRDHRHGPGPNSICRHGTLPEEEVTLAAAVMAIDPADPARSQMHVALGKPCHAWAAPRGHTIVIPGEEHSAIAIGFTNGAAFREFYHEEGAL